MMRHLKTVCLFIGLTLFCAGCASVGFMQNMMEMNRGTLVVTPGMTVSEIKKRSTFDLGEGSRGLPGGSKHRSFLGSARFDWQLPGTNLTFKDCNHYSLLTGYGDDEQIIDIQIGTSQKYLTWDELKAEMYEIEKRLLADGWRPVRNLDGSTASAVLRRELEKPTLSTDEDTVGGATYGKGDAALVLLGKRPPIEKGENPLASDKFTHYVHLHTRAAWEQGYADGRILPR